jgi:hypothetical protein
LRIVLGLPSSSGGLEIRGSLSHFHDADLQSARLDSLDFQDHPEVAQLKDQKKIAELQKKQSNRWWTPSVDAYGGYTLYPFRERERSTLGGRDEAVVGGRITFEIFDGLDSKADASARKHVAERLVDREIPGFTRRETPLRRRDFRQRVLQQLELPVEVEDRKPAGRQAEGRPVFQLAVAQGGSVLGKAFRRPVVPGVSRRRRRLGLRGAVQHEHRGNSQDNRDGAGDSSESVCLHKFPPGLN